MLLYISKENVNTLVDYISENLRVFYLDKDLYYRKHARGNEIKLNLDGIRSLSPLKTFFFINDENVSRENESKPVVLFGVKACDLAALRILDRVLLEGTCADASYEKRRKNTIIISSDCIELRDPCFCTLVEGKPYAEAGYDINLTLVNNGYVCDIKTPKGEEIVKKYRTLFSSISDKVITLRDRERNKSVKKLEEINAGIMDMAGTDYMKLLKDKYQSDNWKKESLTCVQCCGCNIVCPSCYCFFLKGSEKSGLEKIRYWDYCHYTSYARVAGGANPRPKLHERFRNRYQCKFNFRKENFGMYACTGCGRCIEVCPGKIDIRRVVYGLKK